MNGYCKFSERMIAYFHCFHDVKVGYTFNIIMFGTVAVLLCYAYSLFKEVLIDGNPVLLRDQHAINEKEPWNIYDSIRREVFLFTRFFP